MDLKFTIEVSRSNLSPWYYAVSWSRHTLQAQINRYKEMGLDTAYDEKQLQQLIDLEQFLKMSWDQWMDDLTGSKTKQEAQ
jgi:hypothetical protein